MSKRIGDYILYVLCPEDSESQRQGREPELLQLVKGVFWTTAAIVFSLCTANVFN